MPTEPADDPEMTRIYRRYILLHHALADSLHDLAEKAGRTGAPIVRPLTYNLPNDPKAQDVIDEWQLGDDLLVAPVWRSGARSRPIYLPAGTWVDFWDRSRVLRGPADLTEDVPLDVLPLFVRRGSPLLEIDAPE